MPHITPLVLSTGALAFLAAVASAREIVVNTDTLAVTVDIGSGPQVLPVGGTLGIGEGIWLQPQLLIDGTTAFIIAGDLELDAGDTLRGIGSRPAVFLVGNDVRLSSGGSNNNPPAAVIDFSGVSAGAAGGAGRPGGAGGGPGEGGGGGSGGDGGRLGTGGLIYSPNSPLPLSITTPGIPSGEGSAGTAGKDGGPGGRGKVGLEGASGFGNSTAAPGAGGARTAPSTSTLSSLGNVGPKGGTAPYVPPVFWGNPDLRALDYGEGNREEGAFRMANYDGRAGEQGGHAPDQHPPDSATQPNAFGNPGSGGLNDGPSWMLAGGSAGGSGSGGAGGPGGAGGGGGGGGGGGQGEFSEPFPTSVLDIGGAVLDAGAQYFITKLVNAYLKKQGFRAALNIFRVPTVDVGAFGGRGGDGADGNDAKDGARGGQGGRGGRGGGALRIEAQGRILVDGRVDVSGDDGASGASGDAAPPAATPVLLGSVGNNPFPGFGMSSILSPFGLGVSLFDGPAAGKGGMGGNGGKAGRSSDGYPGGLGGGGAGGTIIIQGSVVVGSGTFNVGGGNTDDPEPSVHGGDGRLFLSTNSYPAGTAASSFLTSEGLTAISTSTVATTTLSGTVAPNPFLAGRPATPTIAGLPGGAEAFGPTGGQADTFVAGIDTLLTQSPGGAVLGAMRLDEPPSFFGDDYDGYDMILVWNPGTSGLTEVNFGANAQILDPGTGDPIPDSTLAVPTTALSPSHLSPLTVGGYGNDSTFGGTGDIVSAALGAFEVYAFLVPEDTSGQGLNFSMTCENAGSPFAARTDKFANGDVLFATGPIDVPVLESEWAGGANGNWNNSTNWLTTLDGIMQPAIVPNNATGVQAFNVSINATPAQVDQDTFITIDSLLLGTGSGVHIQDGQLLVLEKFDIRPDSGLINNNGTISLDSSGSETRLYFSGSDLLLTGSGLLTSTEESTNTITGLRSSDSIDQDTGHSIVFSGNLGGDRLGITNRGTIRGLDGDFSPAALIIDPVGDASRPAPGFLNLGPGTVTPGGFYSELRFFDGYFRNESPGGLDFYRPLDFEEAQTITFHDARFQSAGETLAVDEFHQTIYFTGDSTIEDLDFNFSNGSLLFIRDADLRFANSVITIGVSDDSDNRPFGDEITVPADGFIDRYYTIQNSSLEGARFELDAEPTPEAYEIDVYGSSCRLANSSVGGVFSYDREFEVVNRYYGNILGFDFLDPLPAYEPDHVTMLLRSEELVLAGDIENNGRFDPAFTGSGAAADVTVRIDGSTTLSGTGGWLEDGADQGEYRFEGFNPGSIDVLTIRQGQQMEFPRFETSSLRVVNEGGLYDASFEYDHSPLASSGNLDSIRQPLILENRSVVAPRGQFGGGTIDNTLGTIALGDQDPQFQNLRIVGGDITQHYFKSRWSTTELDDNLAPAGLVTGTFNTEFDGLRIEAPHTFADTLSPSQVAASTTPGLIGLVEFSAQPFTATDPAVTLPANWTGLKLTDVELSTHTSFPPAELSRSLILNPGVTAIFDRVEVLDRFAFELPGAAPGVTAPGGVIVSEGLNGSGELTIPPELRMFVSGPVGADSLEICNEGELRLTPAASSQGSVGHEIRFDPPGDRTSDVGWTNRGRIWGEDHAGVAGELYFENGHYDNTGGEVLVGAWAEFSGCLFVGGVIRPIDPDAGSEIFFGDSTLRDVRIELGDGFADGTGSLENCTIVNAGGGVSLNLLSTNSGDLVLEGAGGGGLDFQFDAIPQMVDPSVDRIVIKPGTTAEVSGTDASTFRSLLNQGTLLVADALFTTPLIESGTSLSLNTSVPAPDAPIGERVTLAELGVTELLVNAVSTIRNEGTISGADVNSLASITEAVIDNTGGVIDVPTLTIEDSLIKNESGTIRGMLELYNAIIYGGTIDGDLVIDSSPISGVDFERESITTFQDVTLPGTPFINLLKALLFCSGTIDAPGGELLNEGGELQIAGSGSIVTLDRFEGIAGLVSLNSGTLALQSAYITDDKSSLIGNGTIDLTAGMAVVPGTISPGFSAGQLDFTGDLDLFPTSDLQFEIGGTAAGEFDVLTEAGSVPLELDGALYVTLIDGFQPGPADTFEIITSNQPITGSFGTRRNGDRITVPGVGSFQLNYGADSSFAASAVVLSEFSTVPAGQVIHVNEAVAGGSGDGTSWTDASPDLQPALLAAQAGDEIWVAAGTYLPTSDGNITVSFQLKDDLAIYGGFTGTELSRGQRNADPLANGTVLSGEVNDPLDPDDNIRTVVLSQSNNSGAVLDGFTITGGYQGIRARGGAGVLCEFGSAVILRNCLLQQNKANRSEEAGGLLAKDSPISLIACFVTDNIGVGVILDGSDATIRDCTFDANLEGALALVDAEATITASTFSNNSRADGAAILNEGFSNSVVRDCRFTGNFATGDGGAIASFSSFSISAFPRISLINCFLAANAAGTTGQFNAAGRGGAILAGRGTALEAINCAFSGNFAGDLGGAVFNDGTFSATNCSFSGNHAQDLGGGAVANSDSANLTNCVIWNNRTDGSNSTQSASIQGVAATTFSHCLIEHLNPGGTNLDGTLAGDNPAFAMPVDPSTAPTTAGYLRPTSGSPVIDVGDDTANLESGDLDGAPRFTGPIDLGAYEYRGRHYVDDSATGLGNGSTWENAFATVQTVLATAFPGEEVWVAQGTYYPDEGVGQTDNARASTFQLRNGITLYGGFAPGGDSLAARDFRNKPTILSGDLLQDDHSGGSNAENAYHVVVGSGTNATAVIDGFILEAGHANGSASQRNHVGAGFKCDFSGSPTLRNLIVRNNVAGLVGGAAYLNAAAPSFRNVSFENNQAVNTGANVTGEGGGIYFNNCPTLPFINCTFLANEASNDGGAISVHGSAPYFINCLFAGNTSGGQGGAVYVTSLTSSVSYLNCTFSGNSAAVSGGALFHNESTTVMTNSIVWNNEAAGVTNLPASSIDSASGPTVSHSLVENSGGSGSWDPTNTVGIDGGNNIDADPAFLDAIDPAPAPATGGDFRLLVGSPALDVGDDGPNGESFDLAGEARRTGTIDLGAYEGAFAVFARLHPGLAPDGDENNNGISNYGDYAAGGNPTAPHDRSLHPRIDGSRITFSLRNNAVDVFVDFQKTPTLSPPLWSSMVEGVDYTINGSTETGSRTLLTLDLLQAEPEQYFREVFSATR